MSLNDEATRLLADWGWETTLVQDLLSDEGIADEEGTTLAGRAHIMAVNSLLLAEQAVGRTFDNDNEHVTFARLYRASILLARVLSALVRADGLASQPGEAVADLRAGLAEELRPLEETCNSLIEALGDLADESESMREVLWQGKFAPESAKLLAAAEQAELSAGALDCYTLPLIVS